MHYVGMYAPSLSMLLRHPMESFADTVLSDDCHRCIWCGFMAGVSFAPKLPSSLVQSACRRPYYGAGDCLYALHRTEAIFTHFLGTHCTQWAQHTGTLCLVCAVTLVILGIMLVVSMVDSHRGVPCWQTTYINLTASLSIRSTDALTGLANRTHRCLLAGLSTTFQTASASICSGIHRPRSLQSR